jgi:hypothetical protein
MDPRRIILKYILVKTRPLELFHFAWYLKVNTKSTPGKFQLSQLKCRYFLKVNTRTHKTKVIRSTISRKWNLNSELQS